MLSRSLRHRAPVLWLLLPMAGGLIVGRLLPSTPAVLFVSAAAVCYVLHLLFAARSVARWCITLCLALGFASAAYYQLRRERLHVWDELPPREAQLQVRIDRVFEPDPGAKSLNGIGTVVGSATPLEELNGQRIAFSVRHRPSDVLPLRSEIRVVRGIVESLPLDRSPATFEGYLSNSGVNFRVSRGQFVSTVHYASGYRRWCHVMQLRATRVLRLGLEDYPHLVAVIRGMLLGQAGDLSKQQTQLFTQSGTLHLFSVSGLHIAAIAVALHVSLGFLRLRGLLHFILMCTALWLYVDITGGSPSAVRAYVMVCMIEAAFALRRPVNPIATISLSAIAALLLDPMLLFNASFQMSYGIVAGLILLGLPLAEWLEARTAPFSLLPRAAWEMRHHVIHWMHRTATTTFSVGLATGLVSSLCGIVYFELFTPGALLANVLLIPISTLALWAGFLSLLAGALQASWLSIVFNHAAALPLWIVEWGLAYFVKVPGMFFQGQFASAPVGFAAFGGLLLLLLFGYSQHWRPWYASWWVPFGWTAGVLLFGVRW
jgi:competence protein ComEC